MSDKMGWRRTVPSRKRDGTPGVGGGKWTRPFKNLQDLSSGKCHRRKKEKNLSKRVNLDGVAVPKLVGKDRRSVKDRERVSVWSDVYAVGTHGKRRKGAS